jgi:hypothetical protein
MWKYGLGVKMTEEEKKHVMHGDNWLAPDEPKIRYDGGITINAPAEKVWPYIVQAGQTKAGWYSFQWLENLCTFKIKNHYAIHPEWQTLKPGDYQWFHQPKLLPIGEEVTEVNHIEHWFAAHSDTRKPPTVPEAKAFKPPFMMKYFCWTWNWEVYDIGKNQCRLIWRCDCTFAPFTGFRKALVVATLGTCSVFMGRRCMDVIKGLAEGTFKYPANKA